MIIVNTNMALLEMRACIEALRALVPDVGILHPSVGAEGWVTRTILCRGSASALLPARLLSAKHHIAMTIAHRYNADRVPGRAG